MTTVPTVFVVDDNPGVRRSLQALVEAEGLAVATYASAAEFLEAWDAQRPGCLVLDVRLRGDTGLNLQDELRRRNATLPDHRDDRVRATFPHRSGRSRAAPSTSFGNPCRRSS